MDEQNRDRETVDDLTVRRARKLLVQGLEAVSHGDFNDALEKFRRSAETFATADALTYWGWMEFRLGDTDSALDLCHRAIELDPDFGNPYNDIGSYLFTQGKLDEAIPWLERAVKAPRYEPRQYPHINLGRIFQQKGMPLRALEEYRKALALVEAGSENGELIEQLIQSVLLTLN